MANSYKASMPYHEPDPIWTSFQGITDFETFVKKIIPVGQFHNDVPNEIVKSYKIAEHIMAHSWYYYPSIDEALVKLLRTMEMGVKLRCKELDLETSFINKKGRRQSKDLDSLIKLLLTVEPNKDIFAIMHWLRKIRNHLMHPEKTTLFGTMSINLIQ